MDAQERRFDNHGDARTRLHDTLLLYRGQPVILREAGDEFMFAPSLLHVPSCPAELRLTWPNSINVNEDPDLDFCAPPLGFCNDVRNDVLDPVFISRVPWRRYQQGLSVPSLNFNRLSDTNVRLRPPRFHDDQPRSQRNNWPVTTTALAALLKGSFPVMTEAWTHVNTGNNLGCAFTRQFAFARTQTRSMKLMYMDKMVGFAERGRSTPVVDLLPDVLQQKGICSLLDKQGVQFK